MTSKSRVHRFLAIHDISVKCSPLYRIFWEKITFNQSITFLFLWCVFVSWREKVRFHQLNPEIHFLPWVARHDSLCTLSSYNDNHIIWYIYWVLKKKHLNVTFCSLRSNGNHNFFNIVKCERSSHLFALTKGFGETLIGKHGNKLKHCVVIVSLRQGRRSL